MPRKASLIFLFYFHCVAGARGAIRPEKIGAFKRLELMFPFVLRYLLCLPSPLRWSCRENTRRCGEARSCVSERTSIKVAVIEMKYQQAPVHYCAPCYRTSRSSSIAYAQLLELPSRLLSLVTCTDRSCIPSSQAIFERLLFSTDQGEALST
jgi:hypothetical protein